MANEIKAKITADSSGFDAGLRRATASLDGTRQKMERQFATLNRGLAGITGLLAGGAAAGALDALAKSALSAGGAIYDAARTAGLGAAAFQEYRYAAKLSGVEIETFDKAVATFSRNLGEARRGNKAFAETFAQIGVTARDTNEAALAKTFDYLAGIADRAQRGSVAAELFGARAQRMALLVDGGADALFKMRKEARDLGIVLSNDLVEGAETAGDRIEALETQMRARLNKTLLENIDGFVRFKELLNDGARFAVTMAASVGQISAAFERHIAIVNRSSISGDLPAEELLARRNKLVDALAVNQRQIERNEKDLVDQAFPGIYQQAKRNIAELEADNAALKTRVDEIDAALSGQLQNLVRPGAPQPLSSGAPLSASAGAGNKNPFPTLGAPTLKSAALKRAQDDAAKSIEQITAQVRTPFEALAAELQKIEDLKPFAENAKELASLERAGLAVTQQMRELQVATALWGVSIDDVGRGLSDAFATALIRGESLFGLLKRLTAQLAQQALSNFLFKQIGGFLGLPGRAAGGPVGAGRSYLVGEQGPEVFTPTVNGTIIPNGALAGGGVNVQIVNRFDVGLESVEERIAARTPAIAASVVAAVQKAQARPRFA